MIRDILLIVGGFVFGWITTSYYLATKYDFKIRKIK